MLLLEQAWRGPLSSCRRIQPLCWPLLHRPAAWWTPGGMLLPGRQGKPPHLHRCPALSSQPAGFGLPTTARRLAATPAGEAGSACPPCGQSAAASGLGGRRWCPRRPAGSSSCRVSMLASGKA